MASIGDREIEPTLLEAACATCDFYIESATASDGIPYWDTGAPNLPLLGDWMSRPAEPDNTFEPVDSSAAAIAAQGLLRLGRYTGETRYFEAGLTVLARLLEEPYLSTDREHQGLLLHSRLSSAKRVGLYSAWKKTFPWVNRACGAIIIFARRPFMLDE